MKYKRPTKVKRPEPLHKIKERTHVGWFVTKCGMTWKDKGTGYRPQNLTVWTYEVTCVHCLAATEDEVDIDQIEWED